MKHEFAILALWLIAIVTTVAMVHDTGLVVKYLGPLYLICMIGSILTVRKARLS